MMSLTMVPELVEGHNILVSHCEADRPWQSHAIQEKHA